MAPPSAARYHPSVPRVYYLVLILLTNTTTGSLSVTGTASRSLSVKARLSEPTILHTSAKHMPALTARYFFCTGGHLGCGLRSFGPVWQYLLRCIVLAGEAV